MSSKRILLVDDAHGIRVVAGIGPLEHPATPGWGG